MVERHPSKVIVAGSSPVTRSLNLKETKMFEFCEQHTLFMFILGFLGGALSVGSVSWFKMKMKKNEDEVC